MRSRDGHPPLAVQGAVEAAACGAQEPKPQQERPRCGRPALQSPRFGGCERACRWSARGLLKPLLWAFGSSASDPDQALQTRLLKVGPPLRRRAPGFLTGQRSWQWDRNNSPPPLPNQLRKGNSGANLSTTLRVSHTIAPDPGFVPASSSIGTRFVWIFSYPDIPVACEVVASPPLLF